MLPQTPVPIASPLPEPSLWRLAPCVLLAAAALLLTAHHGASQAQPSVSRNAPEGPAWASLTQAQRSALKPLERDWNGIDAQRKTKWLEIAGKFATLSPAEKERVQARMAEWTRLSPKERGEARMNFKEAQQLSSQDRKAKWETYSALPADERKQLAERAAPAKPKEERKPATNQNKSNIVPNSSYAARPKTVAPAVAQAQPGATTNLISKRASPPAHQQTGLPKITAAPGFVDQTTLLPKRGAQGAATRSASVAPPANPGP